MQEQCDSGSICNQPSDCSVVSSYDDCENLALSDNSVDAFQYDAGNGDCTLYYECCPEDSS